MRQEDNPYSCMKVEDRLLRYIKKSENDGKNDKNNQQFHENISKRKVGRFDRSTTPTARMNKAFELRMKSVKAKGKNAKVKYEKLTALTPSG